MTKTVEITISGKTYAVQVGDLNTTPIQVVVNGEAKSVTWHDAAAAPVAPATPAPAPAAPQQPAPAPAPAPVQPSGAGAPVNAPMPGKVLSIRVSVGDQVSEGDVVCTLEAMKMEMPISAPRGGKVTEIVAKVGTNVQYDDPLLMIS